MVDGASPERSWNVGTVDIDLAVSFKNYSGVLDKLRGNRKFRNVEDCSIPIAGTEFFIDDRWVDVEFINPKPFSGSLQPDEFIEYVFQHRSEKEDGITFANPEVIWYIRLIITDWEIYVQKIMRDIRVGIPIEIFSKVKDVAKHFGNSEVIRARIFQARKILDLVDREKSWKM